MYVFHGSASNISSIAHKSFCSLSLSTTYRSKEEGTNRRFRMEETVLPMKETVAPAGLRVLSVCRVAAAAAPSIVKAKLSFLDAPWVATPPIQEVFLYEKGGGAEYGGIVKRLKETLAASLALHLPFAGKLVYEQETRDVVVVDCSDPGVAFFEAEAMAGCMDLSRLASDDDDVPAMELARLLPEHDARVLPTPVMLVQVTRLNGGGLAIGFSIHHAPADGRAFDLFINAWSSMSRGEASPIIVTNKPPNYSREAIAAHPSSDELAHEVLSKVAPNLPLVNAMEEDDYMSQHYRRLRHRTFVLGADDIRTLRQHLDGLEVVMASNKKTKPVSTFVALSALIWVAFVRAKGLAAGEDTYLIFQVDLRARLRPPVDAGYVGNCVRACIASADAGELLGGDMGLLRASRAIQAAVKEAVEAPLDRIGEWMERLIALPAARQANIGGSPMFRVYQTADFGFGIPHKVVPLSMSGSPETFGQSMSSMNDEQGGRIVLSAGKTDGEVRLSVALDPVVMDAFKNNISNDRPTRSRL